MKGLRQSMARRDADVKAERRRRERNDALDYLIHGDLDGRHTDRCVHSEPCSRDYNPRPYAEAEPDPRLYEGTGIGILYGLSGPPSFWATLAGWNLTGSRERSVGQEMYAGTDRATLSTEQEGS